ncbi:hypothetical protein OAF16_03925, partial [Flavobacteriales bacterium]|nr:hypothetical protein [Flavobacteriales bacterium]
MKNLYLNLFRKSLLFTFLIFSYFSSFSQTILFNETFEAWGSSTYTGSNTLGNCDESSWYWYESYGSARVSFYNSTYASCYGGANSSSSCMAIGSQGNNTTYGGSDAYFSVDLSSYLTGYSTELTFYILDQGDEDNSGTINPSTGIGWDKVACSFTDGVGWFYLDLHVLPGAMSPTTALSANTTNTWVLYTVDVDVVTDYIQANYVGVDYTDINFDFFQYDNYRYCSNDGIGIDDVKITATVDVSDFTWTGAGDNWLDGNSWDTGTVPTSSDNCIFPAGVPGIVMNGGSCSDLTINAGADFVLADPSATINVSGNLTDNDGTSEIHGIINVTGNATFTRGLTTAGISPTGDLEVDGTLTIASGYPFNNNGVLDSDGTFVATSATITQTSSGNIKISGAVTSLGALNTDAGTVTYDGGTAMFTDTYNNLVISSGTHTAGGAIVANGALTVSGTLALGSNSATVSGATDINGTISTSTGTLDANGTFDATGGNVTFTGAGTLKLGAAVTSLGTLTEATGTVEYDGSSQNLLAETYYNLKINGSGTKTAQGTVSVSNNLTVTAGTYSIAGTTTSVTGISDLNGGLSIGTGTYNADGEFDAAGSITFSDAGTLVLSSTVTSMGSSLTNTVGTVKYDGTSAQDVAAPSSGGYYNLTIENASTKTATGNIDVNGALTTEAEASCVFDLSTYDLNVAGNLTVGQEGGLDASDAACAVTFDGNSTVTHAGSNSVGIAPSGGTSMENTGSTPSNWDVELFDNSTSNSAPTLTFVTNDRSCGSSPSAGSYLATLNGYDCDNGDQARLYQTSSNDFSGAGSGTYSIDLLQINALYSNVSEWIELQYSTNGTSWSQIERIVVMDGGANCNWVTHTGSLPSGVIGQATVYFAVLFNSGWGYDISADNFTFTSTAAVTSSNPTFNEIVVNGGDVTLAQDVD